LREELERLFKKKNLNEVTQDEMNSNIHSLNKIYDRVKELNRQNDLLKAKYSNDPKYARIHKRLMEHKSISDTERRIHEALEGVKLMADDKVLQNTQILDNESYFERMMMPLVIDQFKNKQQINIDPDASRYINGLVVKEYMNEFNHGTQSW
jgi:type I restriction enzyme R subunit